MAQRHPDWAALPPELLQRMFGFVRGGAVREVLGGFFSVWVEHHGGRVPALDCAWTVLHFPMLSWLPF